ncbi:M23 family metallopeptidase [Bacillus cereus group sp. Bc252]|uniref:M23 family metallopeptidase n=1 Tax=Bacillus cereus group sp. Bc252 TaxID=3018104 RepID=UPI0022E0DCBA|nr:M23 family metallopeptidase [Bacillus cereus group sp. Bc252]MDA2163801.1 M23 family metallopeptidase [Bacillus cereus group sp. Bc252]
MMLVHGIYPFFIFPDLFCSVRISLLIFSLFLSSHIVIPVESPQWNWTVNDRTSDTFGTRHVKHYRIDIATSTGTPVVAINTGTVKKSYHSNSYGHVVFIQHGKYEAVSAHLDKRYVFQGDFVNSGEIIGLVGNTGKSRGALGHIENKMR